MGFLSQSQSRSVIKVPDHLRVDNCSRMVIAIGLLFQRSQDGRSAKAKTQNVGLLDSESRHRHDIFRQFDVNGGYRSVTLP